MLGAAIQTGRDLGMIPLEKSLARLVRAGRVEAPAARALAADPELLDQLTRTG